MEEGNSGRGGTISSHQQNDNRQSFAPPAEVARKDAEIREKAIEKKRKKKKKKKKEKKKKKKKKKKRRGKKKEKKKSAVGGKRADRQSCLQGRKTLEKKKKTRTRCFRRTGRNKTGPELKNDQSECQKRKRGGGLGRVKTRGKRQANEKEDVRRKPRMKKKPDRRTFFAGIAIL